MKEETKNEKMILQAAQQEFILKGFSGAKTTSIAKRAGVTHAMLHYYYRTKENLFQKVFSEKIHQIATSFEMILEDEAPFETVVSNFISKHFDFIMDNPGLINFVFNEIRANHENVELMREIFRSRTGVIAQRYSQLVHREIAKGTIKDINPVELLARIVTLNLSTSMFIMITGFLSDLKSEPNEEFFKHKKEENIQYILYSIRNQQ